MSAPEPLILVIEDDARWRTWIETAGQFIQNWQTPKTVGVCYAATMTGKDGTQITAYFKTK